AGGSHHFFSKPFTYSSLSCLNALYCVSEGSPEHQLQSLDVLLCSALKQGCVALLGFFKFY
ncbi:hypothetical protein ACQP3F_33585, partial [Escherichia coli]